MGPLEPENGVPSPLVTSFHGKHESVPVPVSPKTLVSLATAYVVLLLHSKGCSSKAHLGRRSNHIRGTQSNDFLWPEGRKKEWGMKKMNLGTCILIPMPWWRTERVQVRRCSCSVHFWDQPHLYCFDRHSFCCAEAAWLASSSSKHSHQKEL